MQISRELPRTSDVTKLRFENGDASSGYTFSTRQIWISQESYLFTGLVKTQVDN